MTLKRLSHLGLPLHADEDDAEAQEARGHTDDAHLVSKVSRDVRAILLQ